MRVLHGLLVATLVVVLLSCGVSRAPLPPSLHLPQPVQDLKASRKGDKVTLTWTVPAESNDQEILGEHLGVTRICREVGAAAIKSCAHPLAEITPKQLPAAKHDKEGRRLAVAATFVDSLPRDLQQQNPSAAAVYAVETLNTNGRSAGPSNQVAIPLAPVPEPPKDLSARVTPEGVVLSFSPTFKPDDTHHLGSAPAGTNVMVSNYVVYRGAKDARSFIAIGNAKESGNGKLTFEDSSADWESAHAYKVTPVTRTPSSAQVEGEDSPPIEVFTHDTFPPSAPSGLQAVSSGTAAEKFIDLTWAPNTESDLAGYNLYRRENVSPPVRINTELITTPAFRDRNVASGKKYTYSVAAVDLRKNESSPSPEASEVVP